MLRKIPDNAFPTTFLIDEDGKVLVQHIGIMPRERLDEYLSLAGVNGD